MEYSAGMVAQVFAFVEAKKLTELLNTGISKEEAWKKVQNENLFQLRKNDWDSFEISWDFKKHPLFLIKITVFLLRMMSIQKMILWVAFVNG